MKPQDVTSKNEAKISKKPSFKLEKIKAKFKKGDNVCISKAKKCVRKGAHSQLEL